MARTVRSAQIETRAARMRLKPRKRPYKAATGRPGLHLGYRRMANRNGSWVAYVYQGASGKYGERAFAQADDFAQADGDGVLTYYDAMQRVAGEAPPVRRGRAYTIADAVNDYVAYLAREKKTASDARPKLRTYVTDYFGDRRLSSLKAADFERWLEWAMTHSPRDSRKSRRSPRKTDATEVPAAELARRRKSTLNRIINYLKAALDRAVGQGHADGREAWARLQKFRGVESARLVRLTASEAVRLMNTCEPDFRRLVQAALLTGCRYGELGRLRARDFESRLVTLSGPNGGAQVERHGTILVAESKAGKPRRVPLTAEGVQFFDALTAGAAPEALLLTKADGTPWGQSEQFRRIRAACEAAKIDPPVNFHSLRHSFASWLVEAGTPLAFVAEALGHADTRMVSKHYAHLAPSIVHATIRANLPALGLEVATNPQKILP